MNAALASLAPTSASAMALISDSPVEDRLATAILTAAAESPDRTAIVSKAGSPGRTITDYATLAARVAKLESQLDAARPIGVVARVQTPESLVVLAAACGRQHVPLAVLADDAGDLAGELADWLVLDDSLEIPFQAAGPKGEFETVAPTIWVATSGTSGPPKLVDHSWDSLLAAARLSDQWHSLAWILVYDAKRWAGMQVWLQALLTGGRLVVPAARDPDVVARAIAEEGVSILPGTPTLLRRLISSAEPALVAACGLERITLGGEAADAALLANLAAAFPQAKISQVYATTELGEVFRVQDGRSGFPAIWISRALPGGARLSVRRDGELIVQLSRDTAEVATGDLVERQGDRFEFVGRRSDVIVVGGAKVFPKRVEELLRLVPGVAEARVFGVPSPITGELVAAEIVAEPEAGWEQLRSLVLERCRESLEPHCVPRVLTLVERIVTTSAGKVPRRR